MKCPKCNEDGLKGNPVEHDKYEDVWFIGCENCNTKFVIEKWIDKNDE